MMTRLIAGAFSLLVLGGLAGAASIGLTLWLYGRDLPDTESLANYEPATLTRVYSGEGALLAEFADERRIFTPIDEIPEVVKAAFISAEDKNFYSHPGVDALGIVRAAIANIESLRRGEGRLQGASTITQQVMKNFLLSSDQTLERKIKEAILAVRIGETLSKDDVLELYLNEIFLGQNAYGVTAAAQRYFGKPLESLTLAEAAYLAALPKAPSDLHPVRQRDRAIERRNYVLREMRENGYIDRETWAAARRAPLRTLLEDGAPAPEIARPAPPSYFTEEVRRRLSAELGRDALYGRGLAVRATIDPDLQEIGAEALRARLESWDRERGGWRGPAARIERLDRDAWSAALAEAEVPRGVADWRVAVVLSVDAAGAEIGLDGTGETGRIPFSDLGWARPAREGGGLGPAPRRTSDVLAPGDVVHVRAGAEGRWSLRQIPAIQGAFMAMDVESGRVLALQGGFDHAESVFNRATQAERQPGSAFKPFVYAAALEAGYGPETVILDAPIVIDDGSEDLWKPKNSGGDFLGPAPMRLGLERSRNLMTIRLAQEIGMERVAAAAERFGVYEDMPPHLSYALGAGETTLWDLVAGYAMFANGGYRIEPTVVDRVQDRWGETIWRHDPRRCPECGAGPDRPAPDPVRDAERVMDPVVAQELVAMMRGVVTRGTAARPFADVPGPVAGKTGTTNEARDVWFVGFTPTIAAGCFIGHDEPRPIGRGAFGGTLCAPVVAEFFREANRMRPPGGFEALDEAAILAAADPERRDMIEGWRRQRRIGGASSADSFFAASQAAEEEAEGAEGADGGGAVAERPRPSGGGSSFSTPGGLY